jgi:maltokinase
MTPSLLVGGGHAVVLEPHAGGWRVATRTSGAGALGLKFDGPARPIEPGDGVSLDLLQWLRADATPTDGWQVLRLAAIPELEGERGIDVDQTNTSVVVGERVVVKWMSQVTDQPHPAVSTLAQLSAVGFERTPTPYAILTWTSPHGHTLPVASVSDYLPGAEDGWSWCVDLVRSLAQPDPLAPPDPWATDLPGRLADLTVDLHASLATSSHVFPRPVQAAGASRAQRWYDGALALLQTALQESDAAGAAVLEPRADAIAARFDDDLGDDQSLAQTPVQHIHGDLHVGQVLRWPGGLSVVDFDGSPVARADAGLMHPAARDVAQMLRSLDHVGQIVLYRSPDLDPAPTRDWMARCRAEFLDRYRQGLAERGIASLFDERLLVAFELEQELRELVYAARHLPSWSYAPRASLVDLIPVPS